MNRTCQLAITLSLAITFYLLTPAPIFAKSDSPQIQKGKIDLEGIRSEIREKKKGLSKAGKKEKNIKTEIARIERKLEDLELEEKRLDREIISMEIGLRKKTNAISDLRNVTEKKKKALHKRLIFLYKTGEISYLKFLFSTDGSTGPGRRYRYIAMIAAHDRDMINEFHEDSANLSAQMDSIRTDKVRLEATERELEKKRDEIKMEKKERNRLLESVRKEKIRYKQSLKELQANAGNLQRLLKKLEMQAQLGQRETAADKKIKSPGKGFEQQKGLLEFPVKGEVVGFFGKELDKDSRTAVYRKGIEISAKVGSSIRAVYGGKIIFAGEFKGYGQMTIIDHGGGFYSLYAHVAKLTKKMNDEINKGDIIAQVGENGANGEPVIYFEVRRGGKPENPMDWLKS